MLAAYNKELDEAEAKASVSWWQYLTSPVTRLFTPSVG